MNDVWPLLAPARGSYRWSILRRLRQGVAALSSRPDPDIDRRLRALVSDERQWLLLARLSSFDRSHHLVVHDALVADGCRDGDVLRAALLHDIGKADGRGRVRLLHRVIRVAAGRCCPRQLDRFARHDRGWLHHGVHLAVLHPALGADLARESGASERVCELIRRHEESSGEDVGLEWLRRADEAAAG